jgi:hypothetical protein
MCSGFAIALSPFGGGRAVFTADALEVDSYTTGDKRKDNIPVRSGIARSISGENAFAFDIHLSGEFFLCTL